MLRILWKIGFLGNLARNEQFACKTLDQVLWKDWWRFVFHVRLDPNNYKCCDIGLWTKYTCGIALYISLGIPLIKAWEQ
jgi:hypothetical protein